MTLTTAAVMHGAPRLTVGIPVYNGKDTITATLESCCHFPADAVTVLVADNCSNDGTYEIAIEYAQRFPYIKVVRHARNLGAAANFRYLLDACVTEYYMWLAADDVIESLDLGEVQRLFAQYPGAICVSPFARVGQVGREIDDRGNRSLVGSRGVNILRFLVRPGVNSRFYSIYRTERLRELFAGTFGSDNGGYFASDIAFSVSVLSRGEWPLARGFVLARKPGISADGWKLRRSLARSWLGAAFPSVRFIRQIVRTVPPLQKIPSLLAASMLYARYLIGPLRHRFAQFKRSE